LELRHLRHFVALAEELHFARAAKKLRMAQPPLSQSIMRLEESLGAKLFDRSSRTVQLTPAGRALLPEARDIVARAELAQRLVERVAAQGLVRLRIGFVPMSATLTLPRAIRAFSKIYPHVEIQLQERTSASQVEALRSGALDLGILVREIVDTAGLQLRRIERYAFVAAVPRDWPLAKRTSLRVGDFAGAPLILFPQQLVPKFFEEFQEACRKGGFTPRIQQRVMQPYTMFTLVAQELGIGVVQDTARHLKIEGVAFVPIKDMPGSLSHEVAVAWIPRAVPEPVRAMIALLQQFAAGR
jgi:DNA-binding transcriptional LysR family regulator